MEIAVGSNVFEVQVEGEGPPILLLHGFPQTSHCWRGVLPFLSAYRTVVPDQRGYSPGARPEQVDAYRIGELVSDALGILDALGVERAHVVGHDWGAAVAWQLGARHPDRVITLTALSVPHPRAFVEALRTDDEQRRHSLYMRDFAQPGYAEVLLADNARGLRGLFGGLPDVDVDDVVRRASEPAALESWLHWYGAQRLEDIDDTPSVTVPTMYIWSDNDIALRRVGAELTVEWVSGAFRYEVLEGISHWIPEQADDVLGTLLVDFLAH